MKPDVISAAFSICGFLLVSENGSLDASNSECGQLCCPFPVYRISFVQFDNGSRHVALRQVLSILMFSERGYNKIFELRRVFKSQNSTKIP